MRNWIYILFFLIIGFLLNIFLFFFSSDYRYFLKNLKWDNVEQVAEGIINDDYDLWSENNLEYLDDKNNVDNTNLVKEKDDLSESNVVVKNKLEEKKMEFNDVDKKVFNLFKRYSFNELELHSRLFDLTSEYPYDYKEFYTKDFNIYFFWDRKHSELLDIFEVLTYELPFTLNEVNNIWEKSFYINLDWNFNDNNIRFIFSYQNRLFWLKVWKNSYNKIKSILDNLKK